MSHPVRMVDGMASEFESGRHVTAVENLPRPGAVQLYHLEWVPTLDGEPFEGSFALYHFRTREEALAEAIKQVKHRAGLAIEITIESRTGCVLSGDPPVIVETVAEARKAIVNHAKGLIGRRQVEPGKREYLRFTTSRGRSAWKSLLECETGRRYDPADPDAGMTCSYLLYEEGNLEGVGGLMWTYGVEIWVTGPLGVWDHPTDLPVGLDKAADLHHDLRPDSDDE